ncbi:MAG: 23S rRNA (guanosine(2251)-2'-O)-methyltransferase RlmB [Ignavibacteriae bacterium]|nr:23S rRNA (guanosine(2251)-2'-O)-methyltransferase RlmB [Ignavibacteriota bacterium]
MHAIIAGRKPIIEALKAGTSIEKIVFLPHVQGRIIQEIKGLAQKNGVQVVEAKKHEFRELANDTTTQGVVAIVTSKDFVSVDDILAAARTRNEKGCVLICDEIEDPHNLGALVRTAECAGVHGVIIPKHHAASVTATVVKVSAGATEHLAIAEVTNIVNTIERLKEMEYWIVGLDEKADQLYTEIDYTAQIALVVGNEGKGIRRLVKEHCDHLVRIPLLGKIDSLNASVAGGLVMYEVVKQRHSK